VCGSLYAPGRVALCWREPRAANQHSSWLPSINNKKRTHAVQRECVRACVSAFVRACVRCILIFLVAVASNRSKPLVQVYQPNSNGATECATSNALQSMHMIAVTVL
jgi:hypothetical protein